MKKLFVVLFVIVVNFILAQSGAVKEMMKFYPLNNGDYWEYGRFMNDNYVNYPAVPYYWLKVMGDTVLSNSKTYKIIQYGLFSDNSKYWRYERIDSTTSSVYRIYNGIEYKIDSLLANPGDAIVSSRFHIPNVRSSKCLTVGEETFFNQKYIVKTIQDLSSSMAYKYKLVKGLGYCYSESAELTFQGDKLLYAQINGVEFGIKTDLLKYDLIPAQFILFQNYPNPFNPSTIISYQLPRQSKIVIRISDILGQEIVKVVDEVKSAGLYSVVFNGNKLSNGVYFYQLLSDEKVLTKKFVLLK